VGFFISNRKINYFDFLEAALEAAFFLRIRPNFLRWFFLRFIFGVRLLSPLAMESPCLTMEKIYTSK
jgi:hypothetical protein